jgi:hypothetical protein
VKAGVTYTYGVTAQTCNRLMPHAVASTSDQYCPVELFSKVSRLEEFQ